VGRVALGAFVIAHALTSVAQADDAAANGQAPRQRYWVDFEAGRVQLDGDLDRLELDRGVAIRVDRYQLTAESVTLRRTGRGVVVDGDGQVAFCRCKDPPIAFGFSQAIVAPPTDLFVEQPTIRVGGVPVLWLPVLWMRAPDRLGLLAPRVAWRGEDGLVAGAGVHVPLGGRRGPTLQSLDLYASGYVLGGVDLEAQVATPATSTRVRFDHIRQSLLEVDARGGVTGPNDSVVAWHVDALRGERGRRGALQIEPAARRYDRAALSLATAGQGWVGGFGAGATAVRAGSFDELGAAGPSLHLGFGSALGAGATLDSALALDSLRERDDATTSTVVHHGDLRADTAVGPFLLSTDLGDRVLARSTEQGGSAVGFVGARGEASVPLQRRFGTGLDPVVHRVEPFVTVGGRAGARHQDVGSPLELFDESFDRRYVLADAGVRSKLGSYARRSAAELTLRGGAVGEPDSIEPMLAAKLIADAPVVAARVEGAWQPERSQQLYLGSRVRVGRSDALHLSAHAEGRMEQEPLGARALLADDWAAPRIGWLDREGFSAGGELAIPWTREIATGVAAEADLRDERLLAVGGGVGYRHACGCLATRAWVGQRVGRDGFDAVVTLDLLP